MQPNESSVRAKCFSLVLLKKVCLTLFRSHSKTKSRAAGHRPSYLRSKPCPFRTLPYIILTPASIRLVIHHAYRSLHFTQISHAAGGTCPPRRRRTSTTDRYQLSCFLFAGDDCSQSSESDLSSSDDGSFLSSVESSTSGEASVNAAGYDRINHNSLAKKRKACASPDVDSSSSSSSAERVTKQRKIDPGSTDIRHEEKRDNEEQHNNIKGRDRNECRTSQSTPKSSEKEFDVHEKILARDGGILYEAKVLNCKEDDEQPGNWKYHVHYIGYKKCHDKWLTSADMLKMDPINYKLYWEERGLSSDGNTLAKKARTKKKHSTEGGSTTANPNNSKKPRGKYKNFNARVEDLRAFKRKHGHCNVTKESLGQFCANVRYAAKYPDKAATKMTDARKALLDEIGFNWQQREYVTKSFEERIEDLKDYKKIHGHVNVSIQEDQCLGMFVGNVRFARKHPEREGIRRLTQKRIDALDRLGFDWRLPGNVSIKRNKPGRPKKSKPESW